MAYRSTAATDTFFGKKKSLLRPQKAFTMAMKTVSSLGVARRRLASLPTRVVGETVDVEYDQAFFFSRLRRLTVQWSESPVLHRRSTFTR
jgi:hypothetical protein